MIPTSRLHAAPPGKPTGRSGWTGLPVMRVRLTTMKNPLKNKFVLIFICLFILVSCVTALTGGSAFIQEHSLAILIVFLLTILILDFIS